MRSSCASACPAPRAPSLANASSRARLTLTSANSAATKSPLITTSNSRTMSSRTLTLVRLAAG